MQNTHGKLTQKHYNIHTCVMCCLCTDQTSDVVRTYLLHNLIQYWLHLYLCNFNEFLNENAPQSGVLHTTYLAGHPVADLQHKSNTPSLSVWHMYCTYICTHKSVLLLTLLNRSMKASKFLLYGLFSVWKRETL